MDRNARVVHEAGGEVIGVIPDSLVSRGVAKNVVLKRGGFYCDFGVHRSEEVLG